MWDLNRRLETKQKCPFCTCAARVQHVQLETCRGSPSLHAWLVIAANSSFALPLPPYNLLSTPSNHTKPFKGWSGAGHSSASRSSAASLLTQTESLSCYTDLPGTTVLTSPPCPTSGTSLLSAFSLGHGPLGITSSLPSTHRQAPTTLSLHLPRTVCVFKWFPLLLPFKSLFSCYLFGSFLQLRYLWNINQMLAKLFASLIPYIAPKYSLPKLEHTKFFIMNSMRVSIFILHWLLYPQHLARGLSHRTTSICIC